MAVDSVTGRTQPDVACGHLRPAAQERPRSCADPGGLPLPHGIVIVTRPHEGVGDLVKHGFADVFLREQLGERAREADGAGGEVCEPGPPARAIVCEVPLVEPVGIEHLACHRIGGLKFHTRQCIARLHHPFCPSILNTMRNQASRSAAAARLPTGAWVPAERDGLPLWDASRGTQVPRESDHHAVDVLVIGAGQAGLAMAYELGRRGFAGYAGSGESSARTYIVLDSENRPGGAWQHRWPSLSMATVNHIADLPHFPAGEIDSSARASDWVGTYFGDFEDAFDLPILRPVMVTGVCGDDGASLTAHTTAGTFSAKIIVNATGTWTRPVIPYYPGAAGFRGLQSFPGSRSFEGKRVMVVGGGISALSHLDDLDQAAKKIRWVTRTPPRWNENLAHGLSPEAGRGVEERVRARVEAGLRPLAVVAETGLPVNEMTESLKERGLTKRWPMFSSFEADGVRWDNGDFWQADAIVWATGFRPELRHLAPLGLRLPGGGILMEGTRVASDHRIHLLGYGPSASTIGARWASREAAAQILTYLGS